MVTVRELLQNVKKSSAYRFHVDQSPMFLGIWFQTIHFILKFRRFQKMWLRHDDWGICIEMINHWLNHEFLLTPGYVHHTQHPWLSMRGDFTELKFGDRAFLVSGPRAVLSNPRPADWFHAARQCCLNFLEIILCVKKSSKRQNSTWHLTISTQIKFLKFIKYMVLNPQIRENIM